MAKKAIAAKAPKKFWNPGKNYFIRTVTHFHTGELVREEKDAYILSNAAWIADTGRFAGFLSNGTANEVEPFPDSLEVFVPKSAVVDACVWAHDLPRIQK